MTAVGSWEPIVAADARADELALKLVSAAALSSLPPPRPVIADLLYADSLAWLYGKPGHGKSFVALDLAASVAAGIPWHGRDVEQGGVLYIAGEGVSGMGRRVDAWRAWHRGDIRRLTVLPDAVQLGRPRDVDALATVLQRDLPGNNLVVIDTQARTSVGLDENSARDMGEYVEALERLRAVSGACILIAHHIGRNGDNPRGSTAVDGAATTMIRVEKDGARIRLDVVKQRDSEPAEPITFRLLPHAGSAVPFHCQDHTLAHDTTPGELSILAAIEALAGSDGAPPTRIIVAAGLPDRTGYRLLSALVTRGLVVKHADSRRPLYAATTLGRAALTANTAKGVPHEP